MTRTLSLVSLAVVLVTATLVGQRGMPTSPRPPWVLENKNAVPVDLPAGVRAAVIWDGIDESAPIGAVADLNDDGILDYLLKSSSRDCGSGGCRYGIIDGKSGTPVGSVFGNPIIVRLKTTGGFHNIDTYFKDSASSGTLLSYTFKGSQYVIQSRQPLAGRALTELFRGLSKIPRWPPAKPF